MNLLDPVEMAAGGDVMRVSNPAPGVVYCRVVGRGHLAQIEALLAYEEQILEQHPDGLWVFHDWSEVTGYGRGVRAQLVAWDEEHADRMFRSELTFRSRIVAMGVSVAAMVLPKIRVCPTLEELQQSLNAAIEIRTSQGPAAR